MILGFAGALLSCQPALEEPADHEAPASAELDAIAGELWDAGLERSALLRMREGLSIERLDDLSHAAAEAAVERARGFVARLDAIDAGSLDEAELVTLESLRWQLATAIEGHEFFWHEGILPSYSSPLPSLRSLFAAMPLSNPGNVDAYIDLVDDVGPYVVQLEERVRGQHERGIVVPRPNLHAAQGIVSSLLVAPREGPFWFGTAPPVAAERTSALDAAERQRLESGIEQRVRESVHPAAQSLLDYLQEDYAAAAPEEVGARQWPRGEEYYRFAVRRSTTMDVTPEEVHRVGLELVAEMEAEMDSIREATGFEGDRAAFRRFLQTDPRFFPDTPEEVGDRLMTAAEKMEAHVEELFLRRPRAPYGAERLDPALEPSQTYGYYDAPSPKEPRGIYYFNGSRLDQRSWLNLEAVSLHELIPGHHFHIGRQLENESLPRIRRNDLHGAYTEGWGSYASALGDQVGIYADPYSRYGYFVLEIFLATRLVVDPGMNLMGWSLEQGRDYMRQHTLESETQIATESLRYSADIPAQALAYQMGKRKLIELRERARAELGDRFDVRRFHEAVLEHGSLPMAVLERSIERFIEREKAGADA
ncbi:MAG TPA: DUF885 domain-containing protein [Thermoanaerobaculia bacterium]|nr:DUF885 domain-containing protein [Thermoanaerobaculia bacterium]